MNEQHHLLFQAIEGHAKSRPQQVSVVDANRMLTWQQLCKGMNSIAAKLLSEGLSPGDRCVILAANTVEHVLLTLGIARAGGVVTPLSLMLNEETLQTLVGDADPVYLFSDQIGRARLGDVSACSLRHVFTDAEEFADFLNAPPLNHSNQPDHVATFSIIYSSGTTGVPKGILHTHQARTLYGMIFAMEYGISSSSRVLLTTALYSNASWMLMLPALFAGATFVMAPHFHAQEYVEYVETHQITHSLLVPTQLVDLINLSAGNVPKLSKVVISAGSKLETSIKKFIAEESDTQLFELYGNTEGVASILYPDQLKEHPGSVGRAITAGELGVLSDKGQLLPPGHQGEIVGRGALMSCGYYNREDLNRDLFWYDNAGRAFVRSGDLGEIGIDGMLTLKGRKKDMIVSGGINVYPVDIETQLLAHQQVKEAAVVAKAHPRWGETPYAFIVLNSSASVDEDELLAWCNALLNKHQRLDGLSFTDQLPRNALGKVVKAPLRAKLEKTIEDL